MPALDAWSGWLWFGFVPRRSVVPQRPPPPSDPAEADEDLALQVQLALICMASF